MWKSEMARMIVKTEKRAMLPRMLSPCTLRVFDVFQVSFKLGETCVMILGLGLDDGTTTSGHGARCNFNGVIFYGNGVGSVSCYIIRTASSTAFI